MADPATPSLSQGCRRRHALFRPPLAGAAAAATAAVFRRLRCLHGNLISASVRFARCPFRLVASLVGLQSGTNSRPQTLGIPARTAICQVPAGHALQLRQLPPRKTVASPAAFFGVCDGSNVSVFRRSDPAGLPNHRGSPKIAFLSLIPGQATQCASGFILFSHHF